MKRLFAVLLAVGIAALVANGQIEAQSKPGSSSSKPSTGSSSSKPSTGSSSSKPSTPPSTGGSTKPSNPPSTGGSTKPGTTPSVKSYTKPSVRPDAPKKEEPKSGPSIRPDAKLPPASTGTTKKDGRDTSKAYDDAAAAAAARSKSKETFVKANQPKAEYVDPKGKTVKIDSTNPNVTTVRNKLDADSYRTRTVRVEHHYHHTYGPRYTYYGSQPYIYVGGGYSPIFYYAMLDWSLERRAAWYYHNQHCMDQALYQKSLADNAQLRLEIEKMKARSVSVNTGYIDPEFADNPDLMYTQEHIDAVYNSAEPDEDNTVHVVHHHEGGGWVILWVLLGIGLVYLVFIKNWKE